LCRNVQNFMSLSVFKIKAVLFGKSLSHPVISRLSSLLSPKFMCPNGVLFIGVKIDLPCLYSRFHDICPQGICAGKQEVVGYGDMHTLGALLVN
jgi:hypothetical protein